MTTAELLAAQLEETRRWTETVIADLKGDEWTFQPGKGLHHALWVCGHIAGSQDTLINERCLGRASLPDSFRLHFKPGGPVKSAAEHDYPPVEEVLSHMRENHEKTCAAVRDMSDALLAEPAYAADGKTAHPNYRDKLGAVAHSSRHEAFHTGQIALIRRMIGKGFLR